MAKFVLKKALTFGADRVTIRTKEGLKMKVKYIRETDVSLTNGQIYEVIAIEHTYYRIVDNTGEDYLYPPEEFEIIEK